MPTDIAQAATAKDALAAALRQLHREAGKPSSRKIAAAVGSISHTTVADAIAGRRIPSRPVLEMIVRHLEGDVALFRTLWSEASAPTSVPHQEPDSKELDVAEFGMTTGVIRGDLSSGLAVTDRGGVAIGTLTLPQRAPEVTGLPVRLASRPLALAGRERLLSDLDARFTGKGEDLGPQLIALCGLGGVGKTSLAMEYSHRHLAEVAVCWQFAAEDPSMLSAQFAVLAAQLGARDLVDPRDPVAAVHAVLASQEAGWILVFDNAPDQASIEPFIPPAGPGRVLITTQNQLWPPEQALDIPVLDQEVAVEFLVSRTGDPDRMAASKLAAELGGLPLALEQAAAYIRATATSLASYLRLFLSRQADLLHHGQAVGHPADVATTLTLALSRLTANNPVAAALINLLAFLASEPVPLALLVSKELPDDLLGLDVVEAIKPLAGDPVAVGAAIIALRRYSLVESAGGGLILVHRLVQAMTRAQLDVDRARQWKAVVKALVEAAIPGDPELPSTWPVYAVLLPHCTTVFDITDNRMAQMARYLGYSGNYRAARDLFGTIANAYAADDTYGPNHPDALSARADFASWTGQAGDAAGARDQLAALLPIDERVLGPEHPSTLAARNNLAYWTGTTGDAASARDQLAALQPLRERVLGPEHPSTLTMRASLARWTGKTGDAAAARDQFAALLPVCERVLGPEHPDTLTTRANLASWTGRAGDAAAARDQFTALLPVCERVLGPKHPETETMRDNLARWTK